MRILHGTSMGMMLDKSVDDPLLCFSRAIPALASYDDAVELLENCLKAHCIKGFAFWAYPNASQPQTIQGDKDEAIPYLATMRGPLYMKPVETYYFDRQLYFNDPTIETAANRTEPFSTADVKRGLDRGRQKHAVFKFLQKFRLMNDVYVPLHTPFRKQVLWCWGLERAFHEGQNDHEQVTKIVDLARLFAIAASDFITMNEAASWKGTKMTVREQQCLSLMARGMSNEQIADTLSVTSHTVKFHIANLMRKLNAGSRAETIAKAARSGWLVN